MLIYGNGKHFGGGRVSSYMSREGWINRLAKKQGEEGISNARPVLNLFLVCLHNYFSLFALLDRLFRVACSGVASSIPTPGVLYLLLATRPHPASWKRSSLSRPSV